MASESPAVSTFVLPNAVVSRATVARSLSPAERSLLERGSAGELWGDGEVSQALDLAAGNLGFVFPQAPLYDRVFPPNDAGYEAALRGMWFDLRAAHRAFSDETAYVNLANGHLPGWGYFLHAVLNRDPGPSPGARVWPDLAGHLRRFGWFTFHSSDDGERNANRLVEATARRQAEDRRWLDTNADLVDALTARLLRQTWWGNHQAAGLLRRRDQTRRSRGGQRRLRSCVAP